MDSLNVKFFNGLSIFMDKHQSKCSLSHGRVEDVYGNLVIMPLKYLQFKWGRNMTEDCIFGQFILRLMSRSLTLEQLIIQDMRIGMKLKEEHWPEGEFVLPKLKTIEVPEHFIVRFPELLPTLLARARNVVELQTALSPRFISSLPANTLKIVKKLQIRSYDYISETTVSSLNTLRASEAKLSIIIAEGPRLPPVNNQMIQGYLRSLNSIISFSSEALRELKIDSLTMYSSFQATLFPPLLKNVENLTFEIYKGADPGISRYLLKLPLAQIFPGVKSLKCTTPYGEPQHIEVENNEIFPWPAVKEVKFEDSVCSDRMIEELGLLFPNLCCLEVSFLAENPASSSSFRFRKIWSTLPFLEKLTIRGKLVSVDQNFDAEFCGIYPEEVALLRTKDDEFLKRVNIVPPFAPITHMKSLKVVEVELGTESCLPPRRRLDNITLFLSKVTELVTYGQMPVLEIHLRVPFEVADYLEHLKSFVKLDLLPPDRSRMMQIYWWARREALTSPGALPEHRLPVEMYILENAD